MNTVTRMLAMAALAALCTAVSAAPRTLQDRIDRHQTLMARYAPSVVEVRIYLRLGPEGEMPDFRSRHDIQERLDKGFPLRFIGFAIAPDRVLLADPRVRSKWIERFEIAASGETAAASEVTRYPEQRALELRLEKPLPGVKPLTFNAHAATTSDWSFVAANFENGALSCHAKGSGELSRRDGAKGRDFLNLPVNAIAINASNDAASVVFRPRWPTDATAFASPSTWKGVPADSLDKAAAEAEGRIAASIASLYLRLETKPKEMNTGRSNIVFFSDSDDWGSGDRPKDEHDTWGIVLENGEVVVMEKLTSEETARLRKIELTAPDGGKHQLEFVGAFDEWGAFVAKFPDGKTPAGIVPCRLHEGGFPPDIDCEGWLVAPENAAGRLRLPVQPTRISSLVQIRGGKYVPNVGTAHNGRRQLLFDAEGRLAALALQRRTTANRYSSGIETADGAALAQLVVDRAFNPEFRPRGDDDRVRAAWIGVDAQTLTDEVAREKKATAFLRESSSRGALVGRVYPGTPAANAGLREGDVLVDVRPAKSRAKVPLELSSGFGSMGFLSSRFGSFETLDGTRGTMPWPNVERGVNETFSRYGIGAKVVVSYVTDGKRREAAMTLEQLPVHFLSARRSRNRDIGMTVCDLTFEVRDYYRLPDDAPGVVVAKLKSGDPAAVAGLRAFEIITEVDGEPVTSAKEFGRRIKGRRQLTFSVRRLTTTRIVRIDLGETK